MEDLARDKRGDWKPSNLIEPSPLFAWPFRPVAVIKWAFGYPGYLLPWVAFYAIISIATWAYLTPDLPTMRDFKLGWIAFIFGRNMVLLVLCTSGWHIRLYVHRAQGTAYKYNGRWLAKNNSAFVFGDQVLDNAFWTVISGVPMWTAYEVLMLWGFANGYIPYIDWRIHPVYCALLMLAIPLLHEVHFYFIHRLIHWTPLYRAIHHLHHKNANPGPWSGLAMHPIEHLLYFSGVLIYWVIPAHPLHVIYHLQTAGFLPSQGHSGFERLVINEQFSINAADYNHYLHHKFFECNYGTERVPLDKWFGTFHDGSKKTEEAMNSRFLARRRRG
jgi:sterol desaturase/sphingolipid hydroxylase (fatty acid hydroxylase superfamily)